MLQSPELSIIQALQIAALLPSIFLIGLLFVVTRPLQIAWVPAAFFFVLMASFLPGILSYFHIQNPNIYMVLMWLESTQPSFIFLLIIQLWRHRVPHWTYWLILALPLVGGSSSVYATFTFDEVCFQDDVCVYADNFRILYNLFASSAIFLLLLVHIAHIPIKGATQRYESHRYWVIIVLIAFGVLLITNDFALLKEQITFGQHELISMILRISFIYLVTTSVLRLFDSKAMMKQRRPTSIDSQLIEALETAMQEEKLYREMGMNREQLAQKIGVTDKKLSRSINQVYHKNFNEYVNAYRVGEAKERLEKETTAITIIAFEVGFSSIASFNRVFKHEAGLSPAEYRMRYAVVSND